MLQIAIFAVLIGLMAWHIRRNRSAYPTGRDPFPAARRGWKLLAVAIWGFGMLAMTTYPYLWYDYQQNKPRSPQPSTGSVYPQYMRGVTVYLTHGDKSRLDFSSNVGFGCVVGLFIVFGVMQRQQQRVDEQRYSRPT